MKMMKSMLTALAVSVFVLSCALIAQGSTFRSFVSDTGSDGNTASDCQPAINACRTFQAAIGQTNAGGDVVALSSTGYSAFSVNKSITIEGAPGVTAFIFVGAGGTGITITGASTDLVVLRNIYVDGLGNGSTTGLSQTGAAKVIVQNCTFRSLITGVNVNGTVGSRARMDLINSDFYTNTTAVVADGAGANIPGDPAVVSVSLIRINGGNITGNTTGLLQKNPGTDPGNANLPLTNIWVFLTGTSNAPVGNLNLIGNATNATCSGTANCSTFPSLYSMGQNLAN
jgi:hypothetical protein